MTLIFLTGILFGVFLSIAFWVACQIFSDIREADSWLENHQPSDIPPGELVNLLKPTNHKPNEPYH